jgi:hypothetical protein
MAHKAERTAWQNTSHGGHSNAEQTSLGLISASLIQQPSTADACWGKGTLHKARGAESQRDEREGGRQLSHPSPISASLAEGGNPQPVGLWHSAWFPCEGKKG